MAVVVVAGRGWRVGPLATGCPAEALPASLKEPYRTGHTTASESGIRPGQPRELEIPPEKPAPLRATCRLGRPIGDTATFDIAIYDLHRTTIDPSNQ